MIKAVFFDMNETLLNLSLLKNQFDKHFNDKYVLKYWFTKLLYSSNVMGIMDEYQNFGKLADVALENIFFENNKPLSSETKAEILGAFRRLPAYDDVIPALDLLRQKKIRAIAVSNSSLTMIKEQLTNAGIIDKFDSYYSVDNVKKYKPFKEIYLSSAKTRRFENRRHSDGCNSRLGFIRSKKGWFKNCICKTKGKRFIILIIYNLILKIQIYQI